LQAVVVVVVMAAVVMAAVEAVDTVACYREILI
jgi:hypothetical protein